jgi:transcriptional regulator with XRE-family HTH domain
VSGDRNFDASCLVLFAGELKLARARAGISQKDLAQQIGYSPALVAKIETCRGNPTADFASRSDKALSTDGILGRIQKFVGIGPFPSWFRPFMEYEATAKSLRLFEHAFMPGLLQTEDYARAVLASRPNATDEETEQLVRARLTRQEILAKSEPPLLWVVLDEGVLHRQVADKAVMNAQLHHLAQMSQRPNITVEIVPFSAGSHMGLLGAFAIAEFEEAPTIVYLETAAGGQIAEQPSMVSEVQLTFDALRSESLPRRTSRELILKAVEEDGTD